jgi:hypothetical protein
MRTGIRSGALVLVAMAATLTVRVAKQSQMAAIGEPAGTASQEPAKPAATVSPRASGRKIPCKTAENASSCYWTRGRLERYLSFGGQDNGEDARWHLWKIGTRRVVRVCNGPSHFPPLSSEDCMVPEFPPNLQQVYNDPRNWGPSFVDDTRLSPLTIFGDFEICPLEPERRGKMQSVCSESAKNIFVDRPASE